MTWRMATGMGPINIGILGLGGGGYPLQQTLPFSTQQPIEPQVPPNRTSQQAGRRLQYPKGQTPKSRKDELSSQSSHLKPSDGGQGGNSGSGSTSHSNANPKSPHDSAQDGSSSAQTGSSQNSQTRKSRTPNYEDFHGGQGVEFPGYIQGQQPPFTQQNFHFSPVMPTPYQYGHHPGHVHGHHTIHHGHGHPNMHHPGHHQQQPQLIQRHHEVQRQRDNDGQSQ